MASDEDYVAPILPFNDDVVFSEMAATSDFHSNSSFLLDLQNWTFLNHGAFGAALAVGHFRAAQWRNYLEQQPLRFFDRALLPHLAYSTRLLADFCCPKDATAANRTNLRMNMALLPNVTSGLNSVIESYCRHYGSSAHIVLWDTSYGSVKKMARFYSGNCVTEIPLQRDYFQQLANAVHPEQVLQTALQDTLVAQADVFRGKHPLFILDHVSSNTALTFPYETLARQIKAWDSNAVVLVDGAHGLLAHDLDLSLTSSSIVGGTVPAVDFYLSNGHKWLSAPRGVATMVVSNYQDSCWKEALRPAVRSHGADEGDLQSRFVWDGTRDYAAALSLPVVLDFWNQAGPDIVRQRMKDLLWQGVSHLVSSWHEDLASDKDAWPGNVTLTRVDSSLLTSPMVLVRLPKQSFGENATSTDAKDAQDYLYTNHIEVPIKCINGSLFVRVSCHIYNKLQDFDVLAKAIRRYPSKR